MRALTGVGASIASGSQVWNGTCADLAIAANKKLKAMKLNTPSGSVLALTAIVFSLLLAHIHRHETRELTGRFGSDYLAYKASTPFLIPRCRGWVVR